MFYANIDRNFYKLRKIVRFWPTLHLLHSVEKCKVASPILD